MDLPVPMVVITTEAIMIKKMICGYASALSRPIVMGKVASTAAASPRGIMDRVTLLSRSVNRLVSVILTIRALP